MTLNNLADYEKEIAELDQLIAELKQVATDPKVRQDAAAKGIDLEVKVSEVEAQRVAKMKQIFSNLTPWHEVQMARHKDRPYTLDYIKMLCEDFVELHGDRTNGEDPAIVGGLATFEGRAVMVLGHQKGRDLKERQKRNFGSARPAGFRKALRLMKMAEKFKKPILVFVDTPAAEANLLAEEEGISNIIAVCLREMVMIEVPIVVAVIGEGGSGGALGIAVGDRILMLEHAVYSVIPPEGCAAILWNDRSRGSDAAAALKLTAKNALEFELVDEIISEPLGGAHRDPQAMAETLRIAISQNFSRLSGLSAEALTEGRYEKFRKMGRWVEPVSSEAPVLSLATKS